ncbi:hypothetical protein Tco_0677752, partial [Tanacetum coccineum]
MGKTMTDVKKRNKKFDDVEESKSDIDSTQVKRKKGKMIVIEIYSEIDEESSPVEKKEKIKMVLIEKYLKKKNEELTNEDDREYFMSKKFQISIDAYVDFKSKDGGSEDDIWVDNGKSIVPFDDSYLLNSDSLLLETQSDENNTQSVDMQFDEITIQDDVDKKTGESKKIQCDKGYINEDLGFNFLSTGLEEIEYLIPGFKKGLTNNKRKKLNTFEVLCMIDKQLENDLNVEPSNIGIELVNDLTQILSPKVDMQIGLPGVVRNDDGQTATATKNDGQISVKSKCFHGIKLNDIDSNTKEYVTLQKALSENEKKVAKFIWRACNDGSLFPNVEVAAGILDIWSLVLNHEEKYREKNSGGGNIYCCSRMLGEHLIESGADLIRRRSIFESNITAVLSQSPYGSIHDVDLTAEIDIIDNLDNDVDDISVRYGELPIYLWSINKKENKRKRPAIDNHSDCENAVVKKKKGNKDGTVNERIIPFLPNTDDVLQMDWCSYTLECMVRGCKEYKLGKYFSGPLLLMAIIYVNSTISETIKVEKTVPAFKAWNSKLLLKREQEEIELGGFGHLPIVEDLQVIETKNKKSFKKKNLIENRSITRNEEYIKTEVKGNKDKCEENKGNEEQQETYGESNEVESQNEAKHNDSERIDNIGNLSLSAGQNTTINAPVESIVNEIVEFTVNVVDVLPHICVRAKGSGTSDVATKKQVKVEKTKVLKEKRTVKPSSNFYDRRIKISEPLSEEEKKLVEYIWSDSCPEGDIVFARKGLELECLWFLSLYPEIKVDATIIDAWSDVLNHDEKYRRNLSITSHVYCCTEMLPHYLVEDKNQVNERRRIFNENVAMILENSNKKNFNHVDLVFFPCIKDSNNYYIICFDMKNAEIDIISNINNDVEDISERYGDYAISM